MTPDQMRDRLGSARVARLATVAPGGAPHLVPICFVLEGDTAFSAVDRKPKRTPESQSAFLKSATGKAVKKRLSA